MSPPLVVRGIVVLLVGAGPLSAQSSLPSFALSSPKTVFGASGSIDEALLSGVIGASRLANGSIAIGDGSTPRIVLVSAEGKLQRVLGRRGDGPGELRMPRWLGRCGDDGFAVYDASHSRLTLFSETGALRRTIPVSSVAGFNQLVTCIPGALFFLLGRSGVGSIVPGTKDVLKTALVRIREETVDTLSATIGGQEFYVNKARSGFSEVPLGQQVLTARSSSRLFFCRNQDGRCAVFDTGGVQRASFSIALERQRVTADDWQRARQRFVDAEPLLESQQVKARVIRELPQPSVFPLLDQMQADTRGRLWIRTFEGYGAEGARWVILSPTGQAFAQTTAPRGLQILEIGEDSLLGVSRDADGVESIALYRFRLPTN